MRRFVEAWRRSKADFERTPKSRLREAHDLAVAIGMNVLALRVNAVAKAARINLGTAVRTERHPRGGRTPIPGDCRQGTGSARTARPGPHQRRDRRGALHLDEDRVGPRDPHPRQARRFQPNGSRAPRQQGRRTVGPFTLSIERAAATMRSSCRSRLAVEWDAACTGTGAMVTRE